MSESSQRFQRWITHAASPVDPASFTAFRAAFGLLLFAESARFFLNDWIQAHLRGPTYHFIWPGFDWVQPAPGIGLEVIFSVLGIAAVVCAFARGWMVRVSAILLAFGWTYVSLLDQALFLNHHYLAVLLCLGIAAMPVDIVPRWGLWWFRGLLVCVYFWAGVSKLDGDWAAGMPLAMSLELSALGPTLDSQTLRLVGLVGSWGIIGLELGTPVLFAFPRSRYAAMFAYVAFHLSTMALYNIGIFPWMSLALLSVWLPENWPRRWGGVWTAPARPVRRNRMMYPAMAALVVLGLLPIRGLLSEGNAAWTMEGARMNWRLLVSHKTGWVRYRVSVEGQEGETEVSPLTVLTPWQASKMARSPFLIRQFAQWLSQEQARRGLPPIEVRADSSVSLNGRAPTSLVNPRVDLAAVTDEQALFSWVMPLKEPLPERPIHHGGQWWLDNMWGHNASVLQMTSAAEANDDESAQLWMMRAMRLEPERHTVAVLRIEGLRRIGRTEQALTEIDQWLTLTPDHPKAWEQRGLVFAETQRPVMARSALEHAIELNSDGSLPRSAEALAHLAAGRGDAVEAEKWFGVLQGWEPNHVDSALSRAELLHRHLDRPSDALDTLRAAARHNPEDPRLRGAIDALENPPSD